MVDCYNMDKHLECSYHLIYYQVSGSWASLAVDIYLSGCGHASTPTR